MGIQMIKKWRLTSNPVGAIRVSDFEWWEEALSAPGEGEVLVRLLHVVANLF